jgi:DNA-directed RNA polymerase II subunit RPB2
VSGTKNGSYEKLNDKGYVDEETVVEYNDAILGKITPVSDNVNANSKPYRCTSEFYKLGVPGVVDRVYLNTSNQDGYETRKLSIRSERVPTIGDKYCSLHGLVVYPKTFKLHEQKCSGFLPRGESKVSQNEKINLNRCSEIIK